MRVFLSGTSFLASYGGPAYSVPRLAMALGDAGADVGLWSPDGSAQELPAAVSHPRVTRFAGSIAAAISEFGDPDLIHDNGLWRRHNHQIARVSRKLDVPRVVSVRGMLEPWALRHRSLKKKIAWSGYQKRDLISAAWLHATTVEEAVNIRSITGAPPTYVIPNGIDVPDVRGSKVVESSIRTAVFLGRLYPVKGLPDLIEAWGRVKPAGWRLVIAGPDEKGHLTDLQRIVLAGNLESVVTFPGPLTGAAKSALLEQSSLFVLPSRSESFGIVVAEALSFGVPVMTTTAVPWPSLESSRCGWRVPPDVASLAAGLRRATSMNEVSLREMGARGRNLMVRDYQWASIADEFLVRYRAALE